MITIASLPKLALLGGGGGGAFPPLPPVTAPTPVPVPVDPGEDGVVDHDGGVIKFPPPGCGRC